MATDGQRDADGSPLPRKEPSGPKSFAARVAMPRRWLEELLNPTEEDCDVQGSPVVPATSSAMLTRQDTLTYARDGYFESPNAFRMLRVTPPGPVHTSAHLGVAKAAGLREAARTLLLSLAARTLLLSLAAR